MFLVIARWKSRPSLATNAVKRVTFLVIALRVVQQAVVEAVVVMVADFLTRSAIAAASPATSPAHVLRLQEATLATEVEVILLLVVEALRLAIPAVELGIYRATAFKGPSAITVRAWATSAVTALNLRGAPATRVVQKATFLVIVPVQTPLRPEVLE